MCERHFQLPLKCGPNAVYFRQSPTMEIAKKRKKSQKSGRTKKTESTVERENLCKSFCVAPLERPSNVLVGGINFFRLIFWNIYLKLDISNPRHGHISFFPHVEFEVLASQMHWHFRLFGAYVFTRDSYLF